MELVHRGTAQRGKRKKCPPVGHWGDNGVRKCGQCYYGAYSNYSGYSDCDSSGSRKRKACWCSVKSLLQSAETAEATEAADAAEAAQATPKWILGPAQASCKVACSSAGLTCSPK